MTSVDADLRSGRRLESIIYNYQGEQTQGERVLGRITRTITMQYSFFSSAIRTWNTPPQQLASMTSLEGCRQALANTTIVPQNYSFCFQIVYTGHFNCTWGAVLLCHMNSVIILNHEFCTYRRRRRRRRTGNRANGNQGERTRNRITFPGKKNS